MANEHYYTDRPAGIYHSLHTHTIHENPNTEFPFAWESPWESSSRIPEFPYPRQQSWTWVQFCWPNLIQSNPIQSMDGSNSCPTLDGSPGSYAIHI